METKTVQKIVALTTGAMCGCIIIFIFNLNMTYHNTTAYWEHFGNLHLSQHQIKPDANIIWREETLINLCNSIFFILLIGFIYCFGGERDHDC